MTPEEKKFIQWQINRIKAVEEKDEHGGLTPEQKKEEIQTLQDIGVLDENYQIAKPNADDTP